jgi:hypothetical protein
MGAPTINVKTSTTGLEEVPELEILEHSACGAGQGGEWLQKPRDKCSKSS